MKKLYFFLAAACISSAASAQSHLIHYWHFNSYALSQYTDTIHGISADYSTIDVNKAKILYAKVPGTSAAYSTYIDSITVVPADYDTINARMAQPDGTALRVRNPSDSMKLLFYIPTTNYKNIKLTYATQSSSVTKGQLHQVFDYSVDSGATWRTTGLSEASDSAWLVYKRVTVTFSDAQVENNPKLVFRITFNGNDTGTRGNNRFDNVTVDGDTLTGVNVSNVISQNSIKVYPNPVHDMLNIELQANTTANVAIYDLNGQQRFEAVVDEKHKAINVSQLSAGTYFISVRTSAGEKKIKFIKQ